MWRSRRPEILVVLALAACHHDASDPAPRLPAVKVMTLHKARVSTRVAVAGVLSPLPGKDVKVGALVIGRVDRVFVAEGDAVKVGQPLAHVEAEPLRQSQAQAQAQKQQAVAQLDNARTRLARSERLFQDGISAKQEVDDARAALVAAESAVKQADATGGIATVQLDRATLRAPIAGVVAAILVPAGQPVDGNGTPVIEIADTDVLDLRAAVASARIGEVSVGQAAALDVEGNGEVAGTVEAIAPLVDPATNTVLVRIRVPNGKRTLRGGLFARGAILGREHDGLAIPRTALLPGDGGAANQVAIVVGAGGGSGSGVGDGDVVAHRALRLGGDSGDVIEVLGGLGAGDRVIVSGGYALPDGSKVSVVP